MLRQTRTPPAGHPSWRDTPPGRGVLWCQTWRPYLTSSPGCEYTGGRFWVCRSGGMADAHDSKSCGVTRVGSSPTFGTNLFCTGACRAPCHLDGWPATRQANLVVTTRQEPHGGGQLLDLHLGSPALRQKQNGHGQTLLLYYQAAPVRKPRSTTPLPPIQLLSPTNRFVAGRRFAACGLWSRPAQGGFHGAGCHDGAHRPGLCGQQQPGSGPRCHRRARGRQSAPVPCAAGRRGRSAPTRTRRRPVRWSSWP